MDLNNIHELDKYQFAQFGGLVRLVRSSVHGNFMLEILYQRGVLYHTRPWSVKHDANSSLSVPTPRHATA